MSPELCLDSLPQPIGNSWNWILQLSGKTFEWLGHTLANGSTGSSPFLKSYMFISRDMSKNHISLQLSPVTTEDTTIYYCARHRKGISL
jgi:hypothetical protein